MMLRRSILIAILLASLPCAALGGRAAAFAKPNHPSPSATPAVERAGFTISGKVTKVDYAANEVVVASNGRSVTIAVTPTTAIDVGGEPGSIADIRPGVRIHAEGTQRGGALVAVSISVL